MAKTIRELTADLLAAPSACKEVKEAAQNYLDAAGKEGEAAAAKAYVAELEADIMPIDGLISFAGSDMGAKVFGADGAKNILAHAKERKAKTGENAPCCLLRSLSTGFLPYAQYYSRSPGSLHSGYSW